MTFPFFHKTFPIVGQDPVRVPVRRPRLVARWWRADDGVLECRWARDAVQDGR